MYANVTVSHYKKINNQYLSSLVLKEFRDGADTFAPCYYVDSDIMRSVVYPEFLSPGEMPNGPA